MSVIYQFFEMVLDLLPDSPVQEWILEFKDVEWLGYLNFFIPISFMVNVTSVWVGLLVSYRVIKVLISFVQSLLK